MNFSFSGVIIIDKFGFTSRRFECNAKMLATEILVDGCRHIHQLVHSKYSALPSAYLVPTPQCLVTWRYALWFSILYRSFVKYFWSKNVSIHWRQMLGDCRSSQGCLENIDFVSIVVLFFFSSLSTPLSTVKN